MTGPYTGFVLVWRRSMRRPLASRRGAVASAVGRCGVLSRRVNRSVFRWRVEPRFSRGLSRYRAWFEAASVYLRSLL